MKKAKDIMTTEVVRIQGSATVKEAINLMKETGLRALIVERRNEEDAYGIVTETDIVYKVIAYGKDPSTVQVHEIMTKPVITVNKPRPGRGVRGPPFRQHRDPPGPRDPGRNPRYRFRERHHPQGGVLRARTLVSQHGVPKSGLKAFLGPPPRRKPRWGT
jgi:hypothetical protein